GLRYLGLRHSGLRLLGLRILGLRILGLRILGLRHLGLRHLGLRLLGLRILGLRLLGLRHLGLLFRHLLHQITTYGVYLKLLLIHVHSFLFLLFFRHILQTTFNRLGNTTIFIRCYYHRGGRSLLTRKSWRTLCSY